MIPDHNKYITLVYRVLYCTLYLIINQRLRFLQCVKFGAMYECRAQVTCVEPQSDPYIVTAADPGGPIGVRTPNGGESRVKRLSQLRFELDSSSICARFELDSIREPCHNCDSIRYALNSSSIRAFEKRMNMFNFFHYRIELESSSNRIESSVTITIRA